MVLDDICRNIEQCILALDQDQDDRAERRSSNEYTSEGEMLNEESLKKMPGSGSTVSKSLFEASSEVLARSRVRHYTNRLTL